VPIEDGDRFEILVNGEPQSAQAFRFAATEVGADPAAIAQGMLLGCREQFEPALRRLARTTAAPELWLTTDRGREPRYRPGDSVALTLVSSVDGYLFCVSVRGDGSAQAIFPAGAAGGARLSAAMPTTIPGPRIARGLRTGPPGLERIRCWLADRDISAELPDALLGAAAGTPLPEAIAGSLDATFDGIRSARIIGASLILRVE
jgi:hypothetical protein